MIEPWLLAVGALVLTMAIGMLLARLKHPDKSADPEGPDAGPTDEPYPPGSRPAGPGAESQRPDGRPGGE